MKRTIRASLAISTFLIITAAAPAAGAADGQSVAPPSGSTGAPAAPSAPRAAVDPGAAQAFAHQRGISVADATQRLAQQHARGDREARVEQSLAGRSGGGYLDTDGQPVVTTLDAAGDAAAVKAGVRAHRVDDSEGRLGLIMASLDRAAARGGAGAIQGWYVDVPTNTVVVTATKGATDAKTVAFKQLASSFGSSVRVDEADAAEAPKTTSDYLVGGYQFVLPGGGTCSVGFNTVDAANRPVVLTAGHCAKTAGTLSRNGYTIGTTRTANYPGDDFGTFWNSYPSYWQPSPSVYNYNGGYISIRGQWDNPPVGATVCKSGRTTGYTCGTITALNQTVVYTGGYTISGLVRHNACVEPGDSGGSNISAGAYALGVTSGASTNANRCLSKVGQANVSWYQPVGEALRANGLRLLYVP